MNSKAKLNQTFLNESVKRGGDPIGEQANGKKDRNKSLIGACLVALAGVLPGDHIHYEAPRKQVDPSDLLSAAEAKRRRKMERNRANEYNRTAAEKFYEANKMVKRGR